MSDGSMERDAVTLALCAEQAFENVSVESEELTQVVGVKLGERAQHVGASNGDTIRGDADILNWMASWPQIPAAATHFCILSFFFVISAHVCVNDVPWILQGTA